MKRNTKKRQPLAQNWITEEIELANRQGIPASVNGIPYDGTEETSLPLLLEQGSYMEDFVNDERGNIIQINFDRVRH